MTTQRFRGAAFVAAGALAACSNGSVPPSSSIAEAHDASTHATSTACASPPGFAFGGPCATFVLTPKGGTATVPADRGYAFGYVFPTSEIPSAVTLSFGSATLGQIGRDQDGHAFPAYTGFGTTFLYVVGSSPKSVKQFAVDGSTELELTNAKGFPGKTCRAAALNTRTWIQAPADPKVSGTTLSLTLKMKKTQVTKGKFYLAFACK